jgi:hypothetical protein
MTVEDVEDQDQAEDHLLIQVAVVVTAGPVDQDPAATAGEEAEAMTVPDHLIATGTAIVPGSAMMMITMTNQDVKGSKQIPDSLSASKL